MATLLFKRPFCLPPASCPALRAFLLLEPAPRSVPSVDTRFEKDLDTRRPSAVTRSGTCAGGGIGCDAAASCAASDARSMRAMNCCALYAQVGAHESRLLKPRLSYERSSCRILCKQLLGLDQRPADVVEHGRMQ